jgi:hypothetical protein
MVAKGIAFLEYVCKALPPLTAMLRATILLALRDALGNHLRWYRSPPEYEDGIAPFVGKVQSLGF